MEASEKHKQTKNPSISKQETRHSPSKIDVFFICWEDFKIWIFRKQALLDFYFSAAFTPTFPCVRKDWALFALCYAGSAHCELLCDRTLLRVFFRLLKWTKAWFELLDRCLNKSEKCRSAVVMHPCWTSFFTLRQPRHDRRSSTQTWSTFLDKSLLFQALWWEPEGNGPWVRTPESGACFLKWTQVWHFLQLSAGFLIYAQGDWTVETSTRPNQKTLVFGRPMGSLPRNLVYFWKMYHLHAYICMQMCVHERGESNLKVKGILGTIVVIHDALFLAVLSVGHVSSGEHGPSCYHS